jgi:hypothetical protein
MQDFTAQIIIWECTQGIGILPGGTVTEGIIMAMISS